jgi:DNA repair protein RadD
MFEDRWYQSESVAALYNYFGSGKTGNPLVALPTGTGKSIVIARFLQSIFAQWPWQRVMCLTHVKELIKQNHDKLLTAWPEAPAGIYSAGLKQKDVHYPIVFGGVQSVVNQVESFGKRDLLIVDEAHLISGKEDSSYGKIIAYLKSINPNLKVIGLTATPYRMGNGVLSDGPIFTDICYDCTSMAMFNRLIEEGYLCTLIPKKTNVELNASDVTIQNGDYNKKELQHAVDKDAITHAACKEMIQQGHNRQSWLTFASGIKHSEHVAETLRCMGIDAVALHNDVTDDDRDRIIKDFKSHQLRCVVNNNILTTGFDHPSLDMISVLRPTVSTVLWVQMLGRLTRPFPGKLNGLVLDFAGNTKRLGPINDPVIPKRKGTKEGSAPVKICDKCGTYNHANARVCIGCGATFEISPKITKYAGTDELIRTSVINVAAPQLEMFKVDRAFYQRYISRDGRVSLKVNYISGLRQISEYVAIGQEGFAGLLAKRWWNQRMYGEVPNSVDEALKYISMLKCPLQISVLNANTKMPKIMGTIFP